MAWTTPGTATAGDVLTAAFWNTQVRDQFTELAPFFGAWTSFTPTWTNLTVGNGTNVARYLKIGRMVIYTGRLTWGSTTSSTSSETRVDFPFAPANITNIYYVGSSRLDDAGTKGIDASCSISPSENLTTMGFNTSAAGGFGFINNTNPWTWANGDRIGWTITYEAAS